MTALLRHPGLSAPLLVRRSGRATRMTLKIDPIDRIALLVLPSRTSQAAGLAFVDDHLGWLRDRLAALPDSVPFAPGTRIPLLDRPHLLIADPTARRGVWREDGAILVSGPAEFFSRRVADFLKAEARRQILARTAPMTEKLGVSISGLRLGDPKSRWGSCNRQGKLAFSWRLVMAPDWVLTYVVAHEVAHLKEMNHSPRFWRWVEALIPDPQTPRRWLKAHGAALYRYGSLSAQE